MRNRLIYTNGETIGAVIFIEEVPSFTYNRRAIFKCSCGILFECAISDAKRLQTKSCGCLPHPLKRERVLMKCACGCGEELINISKGGYERKFIHGHNKGNSGKPHSIETKIKMSKLKKGKPSPNKGKNLPWATGEKNNHWKGGITPINEKIRKSIEYKLWRESVFKRDNYTCVCCKEKEKVSGKLEAHHIKPFAQFPELRLAIDNGQTLCKECHKNTNSYLNRWLKIA